MVQFIDSSHTNALRGGLIYASTSDPKNTGLLVQVILALAVPILTDTNYICVVLV